MGKSRAWRVLREHAVARRHATNFQTIRQSIDRLKKLDDMLEDPRC
jgi:ribosomal protein S2